MFGRYLIILLMLLQYSLSSQNNECEKTTSKKTAKLIKEAEKKIKARIYTEANFLVKQAIEEDENSFEAYYLLGRIYYEKLNLIPAQKYFKKSLELCKNYRLKTYFYLGNIAFGSAQYEDTYNYLKEYLKDIEKIEAEKEFTEEDYNEAVKMYKYSETYINMVKNPVPFKPVAVEDISTTEDEYLPIITTDNQFIFFTRRTAMPAEKTAWSTERKYKEKFIFAERQKNNKFDKGTYMPKPFNINDNEGGATLTVDNKKLYYTLCKYNQGGKYLNCDIYFSEDKNGNWSEIMPLDSNINKPDTWESQPSISSDGKTLYFISDRKGGLGGYDIYTSHKNGNNKWSKAENMGAVINSKGNEKSPFIHSDSQTLYFSSDSRNGMGGYDIYFSKLDTSGNWTVPKNIGYPINSQNDDVSFFVSSDGHYGYFASDKYNGKGGWDIFSFELYKEARPAEVIVIKGTIKDNKSNEPVNAKIELKNITSKKIIEIPVDTSTGEYAAAVYLRNDYLITVKKEGYAYSSKYLYNKDTISSIPINLDLDLKQLEVGEAYRLNDIYFATDSSALNKESKLIINGFIQFLNENPKVKVAIHGHTDNVGDVKYNLKLSDNRAKSVYEYVIQNGIIRERLSYKGFGDTKPTDSNDKPEGRAKNRRTEFVVIQK